MCASRIQRALMASVLALGLYLIKFSPLLMFGGFVVGEIIIVFVIAMVAVWAIFDFCPSLWFFRKVAKNC